MAALTAPERRSRKRRRSGDPRHGGALDRGRRAGWPQGRQRQRRLAQVRPAAFAPVRAVGPQRNRGERGDERGRVGRPVFGPLGHPCGHQRPHRFGYRIHRHRPGHVLVQQHLGGIPVERRPPGQALKERSRGRVHIGRRAGRTAGELLRRRVGQRPGRHRPVPGPRRDPEIGQLAAAVPADQHVVRLVVPVHHPPRMRRGQAQQRAVQHHQRRLRSGPALAFQDLPQRDPVHQLHHDRRPGRRLDILIQPDHVRVIQRGQHRRLTAEHLSELGIRQQVPAQVLDRHQGPRAVVPGQHHLTEPARAKHLDLGIARNAPPGHPCPPAAVSGASHHHVIKHRNASFRAGAGPRLGGSPSLRCRAAPGLAAELGFMKTALYAPAGPRAFAPETAPLG